MSIWVIHCAHESWLIYVDVNATWVDLEMDVDDVDLTPLDLRF